MTTILRRATRIATACVPLVLAGCTGGAGDAPRQAVSSVIRDELHNGGTAGFFFLPPMVPAPAVFGDYMPTANPSVRIDEIDAAGNTLRTLATFAMGRNGITSNTSQIPDTDADRDRPGYFEVVWDTSKARLNARALYRVRVLVPADDSKRPAFRELGFADVDVVMTSREFRTVDTMNFTPLLAGTNLPIQFRIDRPAVDADGDNVLDWQDNCPTVANPTQLDSNRDGKGDACECLGVSCAAADVCHGVGVCDPRTGMCPNPARNDARCSLPNTNAAVCESGACAILSCPRDRTDCDGVAANGCEVTLKTDSANCGACGVVCASPGPHTASVCVNGDCAMRCVPGFGDCDRDATTGCESDVRTDRANCGACGAPCSVGRTCVAGACTATVCVPGRGNCDGNEANGCETGVTNNVANCGACGAVCAFPNASASCAASACVLGACAAGFANCDRDAANGCESAPASDVANCGACGRACSLAHANPVCAAGACAISTCVAGFADCNANPADGCEVSLTGDVANCGGCRNACVLPHASPVCTAGACAVGACATGFADCDGVAANGCESNLADVTSCGACGRACPSGDHATATCGGGVCGLVCADGFANCDGVATNGCEVNVRTDDGHCGACATACTNATTCQSGACSTAVCAAGRIDCNGLASDGCETTPASDVAHCGTCGHTCAFANAAPTCIDGACGFAVCDRGYGDCDGVASNGCEVNLTIDSANCRGCGVVCAFTHATGVCGATGCALGACDVGYGNCDGNAANGCETNLSTDLTHCGTCATACAPAPNATATCGGACGFACDATHADCNRASADGCEVNTGSDARNCGACGTVCTNNTTCQSGACTAAVCADGFADCNGLADDGCEVDLSSDAANCGACRSACALAHADAACVNRACVVTACSGDGTHATFADCDGVASNGCEVSLSDVNHCGACATVCDGGANASAVCASATQTCGLACDPDHLDCDGAASNGCEVSTASDVTNCGGCGVGCVAPSSATATCATGRCGFVCVGGQADCNGNAGDGCEVDIMADSAHCGACGVACTMGMTCQSGVCSATVCTAGLGNCDGDAANGCEVTLASNASHCGGCGIACAYAHGTGACAASTCSLAACNAGYADCNASSADGCETGTDANVLNCGACGNACTAANGAPSCVAGTCRVASCNAGFALVAGACVDVNECATSAHNCAASATCTNTPGGFTCACNAGYTGNGVSCADVNECAITSGLCSGGMVCTNTPGSYACACAAGSTSCSGACANLQTDAGNCGACGVVCASCVAGVCATACGNGVLNAGEQCDLGARNSDAIVSGCTTACQLTSLVAWFSADDVNEGGAAPASGAAVTVWRDLARGNDATQSDATRRAVYQPSWINGRPAIKFDGVNDSFAVPVNLNPSVMPNVTIVSVFQNTPGNAREFDGIWGQDNGGWDRFMSADSIYADGHGISNGSAFTTFPQILANNVPLVVVASLRNGAGPNTSTAYVNGALASSFAESHNNDGQPTFSIGTIIGPGYVTSYDYGAFDGAISRFLVFNRTLTNAERVAVEAAVAP